MWVLWKFRNVALFEGKKTPPTEVVQEISTEVVHTLKGQYDAISKYANEAERQRQKFHNQWESLPFYFLIRRQPVWNLSPPKWLSLFYN